MRRLAAAAAAAAAAVGLFVGAGAVKADGFDPHRVPADAKWAIHVDVDTVRTSKAWVVLSQHLEQTPNYLTGVEQLRQITGVQFPGDVHDLTIYGRTAGEEAPVIIAHADADQKKILDALQFADGFTSSTHGAHEVQGWQDKGKDLYGAFAENNLVVIGRVKENVEAALDTLDGKGETLADKSGLTGGAHPGVLLYAAGQDLAALKVGSNPLLEQVNDGWASISEESDHLLVKANVAAKTADAANQLAQTLLGIRALVTMAANGDHPDPGAKTAAAALAGLTSRVQDQTLTLECPVSLDVMRDLLAKARAADAQKAADAQRAATAPAQ